MTKADVIAAAVVIAIAILLIPGLCTPRFSPRSLSPRLVCGSNMKGIGTSCKIYSNENGGSWPIPAFDESFVGRINYRVPVGGGSSTPRSPNRSQDSISGPAGARELSVSRALWTLVRSGDMITKQLICPLSRDDWDSTEKPELYYDFTDYRNVSYGFQVPYGPATTRPRDGADNRMVLAADKGPYRNAMIPTPSPGQKPATQGVPGFRSKPIKEWSTYNSPNHAGDGQNVLYADGHSDFLWAPTGGVDGDNIYTIALDNFNEASRVAGESPWMRSSPPLSSTDSVIFP